RHYLAAALVLLGIHHAARRGGPDRRIGGRKSRRAAVRFGALWPRQRGSAVLQCAGADTRQPRLLFAESGDVGAAAGVRNLHGARAAPIARAIGAAACPIERRRAFLRAL